MSVAVYPRLDQLLRDRNLTPAELARLIQSRYGVSIDAEALSHLTRAEPIERADLTAAGAAAAVLGLQIGDLFDVEAVPLSVEGPGGLESFLNDIRSQRLAELFDLQDAGRLTEAEQRELDELVTEYGRQFGERKLRQFARQRGIPVERARREADVAVVHATQRWHGLAAGTTERKPRGRRRPEAPR